MTPTEEIYHDGDGREMHFDIPMLAYPTASAVPNMRTRVAQAIYDRLSCIDGSRAIPQYIDIIKYTNLQGKREICLDRHNERRVSLFEVSGPYCSTFPGATPIDTYFASIYQQITHLGTNGSYSSSSLADVSDEDFAVYCEREFWIHIKNFP